MHGWFEEYDKESFSCPFYKIDFIKYIEICSKLLPSDINWDAMHERCALHNLNLSLSPFELFLQNQIYQQLCTILQFFDPTNIKEGNHAVQDPFFFGFAQNVKCFVLCEKLYLQHFWNNELVLADFTINRIMASFIRILNFIKGFHRILYKKSSQNQVKLNTQQLQLADYIPYTHKDISDMQTHFVAEYEKISLTLQRSKMSFDNEKIFFRLVLFYIQNFSKKEAKALGKELKQFYGNVSLSIKTSILAHNATVIKYLLKQHQIDSHLQISREQHINYKNKNNLLPSYQEQIEQFLLEKNVDGMYDFSNKCLAQYRQNYGIYDVKNVSQTSEDLWLQQSSTANKFKTRNENKLRTQIQNILPHKNLLLNDDSQSDHGFGSGGGVNILGTKVYANQRRPLSRSAAFGLQVGGTTRTSVINVQQEQRISQIFKLSSDNTNLQDIAQFLKSPNLPSNVPSNLKAFYLHDYNMQQNEEDQTQSALNANHHKAMNKSQSDQKRNKSKFKQFYEQHQQEPIKVNTNITQPKSVLNARSKLQQHSKGTIFFNSNGQIQDANVNYDSALAQTLLDSVKPDFLTYLQTCDLEREFGVQDFEINLLDQDFGKNSQDNQQNRPKHSESASKQLLLNAPNKSIPASQTQNHQTNNMGNMPHDEQTKNEYHAIQQSAQEEQAKRKRPTLYNQPNQYQNFNNLKCEFLKLLRWRHREWKKRLRLIQDATNHQEANQLQQSPIRLPHANKSVANEKQKHDNAFGYADSVRTTPSLNAVVNESENGNLNANGTLRETDKMSDKFNISLVHAHEHSHFNPYATFSGVENFYDWRDGENKQVEMSLGYFEESSTGGQQLRNSISQQQNEQKMANSINSKNTNVKNEDDQLDLIEFELTSMHLSKQRKDGREQELKSKHQKTTKGKIKKERTNSESDSSQSNKSNKSNNSSNKSIKNDQSSSDVDTTGMEYQSVNTSLSLRSVSINESFVSAKEQAQNSQNKNNPVLPRNPFNMKRRKAKNIVQFMQCLHSRQDKTFIGHSKVQLQNNDEQTNLTNINNAQRVSNWQLYKESFQVSLLERQINKILRINDKEMYKQKNDYNQKSVMYYMKAYPIKMPVSHNVLGENKFAKAQQFHF